LVKKLKFIKVAQKYDNEIFNIQVKQEYLEMKTI